MKSIAERNWLLYYLLVRNFFNSLASFPFILGLSMTAMGEGMSYKSPKIDTPTEISVFEFTRSSTLSFESTQDNPNLTPRKDLPSEWLKRNLPKIIARKLMELENRLVGSGEIKEVGVNGSIDSAESMSPASKANWRTLKKLVEKGDQVKWADIPIGLQRDVAREVPLFLTPTELAISDSSGYLSIGVSALVGNNIQKPFITVSSIGGRIVRPVIFVNESNQGDPDSTPVRRRLSNSYVEKYYSEILPVAEYGDVFDGSGERLHFAFGFSTGDLGFGETKIKNADQTFLFLGVGYSINTYISMNAGFVTSMNNSSGIRTIPVVGFTFQSSIISKIFGS